MCHFEKGLKDDITIVLSCPGQEEEIENKPAAGKTGSNLGTVLATINGQNELSWNRRDVTITNAWNKVEYKGKTGRTEATKKEVLSDENLKRLYNEIKDTKEYIVAFGYLAEQVLEELNTKHQLNVKVLSAPHLSLQRLNTSIVVPEPQRNTNTSSENNQYRLEVVATKIIEQL
ncbi:uracil-DNA glycosylase family protein [Lysinibacillus xylanilyticus]|uniref:uracil-DNA glycosylase family protein n=1 Tax=Lysinibacillus xylanilyticus TaxID=582475 RepID=UPI00382941D3